MRQIVFDTETTGFDPSTGDRLVEIGAVEVINYIPTGKTYHQYINPERDIPEEVVAVHGIDNERVKDEPTFAEVVGDFLEFIGSDPLVAHNADFDMKFINYQLEITGFPAIDDKRVIDSLAIARRKFPGSPASLDALCRRFEVDNSARTYHGALLDSELLAEVYLELMGGRQQGLILGQNSDDDDFSSSQNNGDGKIWPVREFQVSDAEYQEHLSMRKKLKDSLWDKYSSTTS